MITTETFRRKKKKKTRLALNYNFLEVETAFMGELYNINAFDQPGAEIVNTVVSALLGKKGYKDRIKQFAAPKDRKQFII